MLLITIFSTFAALLIVLMSVISFLPSEAKVLHYDNKLAELNDVVHSLLIEGQMQFRVGTIVVPPASYSGVNWSAEKMYDCTIVYNDDESGCLQIPYQIGIDKNRKIHVKISDPECTGAGCGTGPGPVPIGPSLPFT